MASRFAECSTTPFEATADAKIPQFRPRSAFSFSSMASQPANPGCGRNQDRALRSLSHPFVERLIGTVRRECLDRTLFWTTADLENKLLDFKTYFNHHRTHTARMGRPPDDAPTRRSRTCSLIDGNLTVEAYIKHRSLLEFPDSGRCRMLMNLAQLHFLIPSLDQRRIRRLDRVPLSIHVNRGSSASAIGSKLGFDINSPGTPWRSPPFWLYQGFHSAESPTTTCRLILGGILSLSST